jgi:hypothetical protein
MPSCNSKTDSNTDYQCMSMVFLLLDPQSPGRGRRAIADVASDTNWLLSARQAEVRHTELCGEGWPAPRVVLKSRWSRAIFLAVIVFTGLGVLSAVSFADCHMLALDGGSAEVIRDCRYMRTMAHFPPRQSADSVSPLGMLEKLRRNAVASQAGTQPE